VSSHRARALTCGTSLNSAARIGDFHVRCSRVSKADKLDCDELGRGYAD
jgi:hypothetical protein